MQTIKKLFNFFGEVRQELSKVVWPSYGEFIGSTIVALIIMAAATVYLGAVDFTLIRLIEYVYAL